MNSKPFLMIDRLFCADQFLRFSGLPGYPKTDQGKAETLNAMQRAFRSESELLKVVEDLIRASHKCPVPADFYGASATFHLDRREPLSHCTTCYDRGTVLGWFLFSYGRGGITRERITEAQKAALLPKIGFNQRLYEGPVACVCRGGQPDPKWYPNGAWPVPETDKCAPGWHCDGFRSAGEVLSKGLDKLKVVC